MSITIDGTTGISGVAGTASTPAVQGDDTNTGVFFPAADTVAVATGGAERLRVDSAGNAGLGVTPSAWSSSYKVLQVQRGSLSQSSGFTILGNNLFDDGAVKYITSDFATHYIQVNGQHRWSTAPSGTAGNAITFTQAMTLDASGNLTLSGALNANYISSEVVLARDYSATFAHGLGVRPSQIQMNLRCVSAQLGYAVNDVVYFSGGAYDVNSGQGINIAADATNIYFGTYWVYVRNRTGGGGAFVEITYANWRASMVAWR